MNVSRHITIVNSSLSLIAMLQNQWYSSMILIECYNKLIENTHPFHDALPVDDAGEVPEEEGVCEGRAQGKGALPHHFLGGAVSGQDLLQRPC